MQIRALVNPAPDPVYHPDLPAPEGVPRRARA